MCFSSDERFFDFVCCVYLIVIKRARERKELKRQMTVAEEKRMRAANKFSSARKISETGSDQINKECQRLVNGSRSR